MFLSAYAAHHYLTFLAQLCVLFEKCSPRLRHLKCFYVLLKKFSTLRGTQYAGFGALTTDLQKAPHWHPIEEMSPSSALMPPPGRTSETPFLGSSQNVEDQMLYHLNMLNLLMRRSTDSWMTKVLTL